ncbi:putative tail sheath protein [Lactobacillus phage Lbab1]|nr:putative tail sheath protein [Lactobacillus phage Lbab1]
MDFWKYLHPLLKTDNDSRYSTANYAVLKSLADSLSDAERDTLSKKIQLIFETATGEYLDEYGKWFGVSRYPNEDDNDYRERIKHYLLIPRSTVKGIIEGIQYYLNDTKAQISIYEPWKNIFYLNKSNLNGDDHLPGFYYRYAVIDVHIDRPMSQAIHDAIEAFKPAGVKFYVTVDGNLGEDVKRLILADFKVTHLDTINRVFGFNYARILPFTFADRKDTLVPNTEYFKTNDSKLNGSDVLAGSPLHNVTYWNSLDLSNSPYKNMPVNLLKGSGEPQTVAAQTWGDDPHVVLDTSSLEIGDTVSFQVKVNGVKDTNVFVGLNSQQISPLFSNGMETFAITWTKELSELPLPIEFSVKPAALTDEYTWSQAKAAIGTTASPWSPNPADPEYGSTPEQRAVLSTNNSTYLTLPATKYKDVPVNILTDSGFESGNVPSVTWGPSAIGTIAASSGGATLPIPFGNYMLKIDSNDTSTVLDQFVSYPLANAVLIKSGETWTYSYYYASAGSATGQASDYLLNGSNANPIWGLSMGHGNRITTGGQTAWHRFTVTFTATADITVTHLRFGFVKSGTNHGWICIDNIKLEQEPAVSPWSPNPADPEYYENMLDGTLSLYNQLVNKYSSIVNLYSGSTNYEKVVSMLKDSNITIQEKVVSDKAVLINGTAPNKDGIIDIDKSKISYTGSDITVPLVVTSTDTCRISYAGAGIYIRLALPGMGTNLKSDQLETKIKKA